MNHNIRYYHNSYGSGSGRDSGKTIAGAKPPLRVNHGIYRGTVRLAAAGAGDRSGHEWQISRNAKNWYYLTSTVRATTEVTGLTPGARMFFRHRVFTKDGSGEWSRAVSIIVM